MCGKAKMILRTKQYVNKKTVHSTKDEKKDRKVQNDNDDGRESKKTERAGKY